MPNKCIILGTIHYQKLEILETNNSRVEIDGREVSGFCGEKTIRLMPLACTGSKRRITTSTTTEGEPDDTSHSKRRRSTRGNASIRELAEVIVKGEKRVVIVTGAGISVASGVRPFRSFSGKNRSDPKKHGVLPTAGLWNDEIWTTATRQAFRKNPVRWYNEFWIPHFMVGEEYLPNMGHYALKEILEEFSHVTQITQNIDGLQAKSDRLIEAHGRVGLYKCLAAADSDTDSDSDEDSDRPVHLGHRRKSREKEKHTKRSSYCPYRFHKSLDASQVEPPEVRHVLGSCHASRERLVKPLGKAPVCPMCGAVVLPQALLFDEGYHSHAFYQFERMESLLEEAEVLVFCGTSFSVQLTVSALDVAKARNLPVYNFNLHDFLAPTSRLNAINVAGPAAETIPLLMKTCRQVREESRRRPSRACTRKRLV